MWRRTPTIWTQTTRAEHDSPSQQYISNVTPPAAMALPSSHALTLECCIANSCAASARKILSDDPDLHQNGKPHIGHAYAASSSATRWRCSTARRQRRVLPDGTDEHGLKMQQTADKEGVTPKELADRNSAVFRSMVNRRRLEERRFHSHNGRAPLRPARRSGKDGGEWQPSTSTATTWYSSAAGSLFRRRRRPSATTGVRREPLGSPVEWNEEETYFFRHRLPGQTAEALRENPEFVGPTERHQQVISFVKSKPDLSISRGLPTGACRFRATTSM